MAAALQLIPAGARPLGGGVYQLPNRRARRSAAKSKKKSGAVARHSFFSRQWVWYALALALADALGSLILKDIAPWISVPALFLYAYGKWKNKPGAVNAAYAIQGAHLLAYWGVTGMMQAAAAKAMGR